jgi:hypothetical protein
MTFLIFSLLTVIQLIGLYVTYNKNLLGNKNKIAVVVLIIVFVEFIIFFNIISLSYGDDLIEYKRWFQSIVELNFLNELSTESKGLGFSYIVYFITFFINDFNIFIFLLSCYTLIFITLLAYEFKKYIRTESFLIVLLLFAMLLLLNRYQLGYSTNIIRSYIAGSLFILFIVFSFRNKLFLGFVPLIYFIHDMQILLGIFIVLTAYILPFRIVIWFVPLSIISYFIGDFNAFILNISSIFIKENEIIISGLLIDDYSMTMNRKIQHFLYLILPLLIILRKVWKKTFVFTDNKQQFFIKVMMLSLSIGILFSEITPRADRIILFGLPLLYLFFIMFSTKKEQLFYISLIILVNYIAIYRNLNNFII